MNGPPGGNGLWKWIAGMLAAIMLTGAAGVTSTFIAVTRAPTKDQVDLLRERQGIVLQRLAAIDERLNNFQADAADLRQLLQQLRDRLDQHILEGS